MSLSLTTISAPLPLITPTAQRLRDIGDAIGAALAPVIAGDVLSAEAREAASGAADAAVNARESVSASLAAIAEAGGWSVGDIASGIKQVIDRQNNVKTAKALSTFSGELKNFMHPDVRPYVPGIISVRNAAWDAEAAAIAVKSLDKGDAPLLKCFKRRWHMLAKMTSEATQGNWFRSTEDCLAYAAEHDPDKDAKKQMAAIVAASEVLQRIYRNFADANIQVAMQALSDVTEQALRAAMVPPTVVAAAVPTPPTAATIAEPVAAPHVPDADVTLSDLLGDAEIAAPIVVAEPVVVVEPIAEAAEDAISAMMEELSVAA